MNSRLQECKLLTLKKIHNRAGNITIVEGNADVPFHVKRIFYLYDIPGGENRGGHAHKEHWQLIVAASGSFDVIIDDGKEKETVSLNRPNNGLLVPPGIWNELENFSSGAICLVLTSDLYDADDYMREYNSFTSWKSSGK